MPKHCYGEQGLGEGALVMAYLGRSNFKKQTGETSMV